MKMMIAKEIKKIKINLENDKKDNLIYISILKYNSNKINIIEYAKKLNLMKIHLSKMIVGKKNYNLIIFILIME